MKVLYTYQDILFRKLAPNDEEKLLNLLCETRNPVDKVIDTKIYHHWNKISLQVALKENMSIVLTERDSNKIVAYMIFRDYCSPHSDMEKSIMKDPTIRKYNALLETLSYRFEKDYPNIRKGDVLKLVDSGVDKEYIRRGIAISALKWCVQYARQLKYKCLVVEALSSKGIQLAKAMGNFVHQEEDASKFEGFQHLRSFPVQFTIQWLTPRSKL